MGDASLLSRRANVLADTLGQRIERIRKAPTMAVLALISLACLTIWLPLNPHASRRASWSPWPAWSARVLNASGIEVRDYEVDGHRPDAIAEAEKQIAASRTTACVANGPGYGPGFGLVTAPGQCAHFQDTEKLFLALEEFIA